MEDNKNEVNVLDELNKGACMGRDAIHFIIDKVENADLEKELTIQYNKYKEMLEKGIDISLEEAFYGGERKIAYKMADGKLKTITVNIPRGMQAGESIRLAGQGREGKNGGKNGDMYIKVNILPHKFLRLEGLDLHADLFITPWEGALGCEVSVNGLDSNIYLNVPEGTVTGDKFRIPNAGYFNQTGSRGDLIFTAKMVIPKRLTKEEKELFVKFKEISSYNPRGNN